MEIKATQWLAAQCLAGLLLLSACALEYRPGGFDASILPQASPDAEEVLYLQSNANCQFFVDGNPVTTGKRVRILVTNRDHKIVCKPEEYRAKEEYVQPPYDPYHPIGFTFLIEDKLPDKPRVGESSVRVQPAVTEGKKQAEPEKVPPPTVLSSPSSAIGKLGGQAGSSIDFGRYHALVIGNNDYNYLPKLTTAISDAKALGDLLQAKYGFSVISLINATREEIIITLDRLRGTLTERDNLLIYYAGHGILDRGSARGYWLPVDAQDNTTAQWIATTTITDTLKAMSAKHAMVVADSCYSGTMVRDIRPTLKTGAEQAAYLKRITSKRARTALTSGGLEPVMDQGGGEHSVFAKAFLAGLEENTEVLEGQTLFVKIKRPIMVNSEQTPEYGDIRSAGHDGGDFLFVPQGGPR